MYKIKLKDLPHGISGIYLLEINNKYYVGQSKDIKERVRHHNLKCITETVVDKAINKYGKVKEIIILEEIDREYCRSVISDINYGKKQPLKGYDYPARETKNINETRGKYGNSSY